MKVDPEVEKYLKRKKWSFTENATQFIVKTCPFCGDKKHHFYINKSTGQYICWKCDENGNLYTLKKSLGDLGKIKKIEPKKKVKISKKKYNKLRRRVNGWNNALLSNRKALSILKKKWGFDRKVAKRFKLGLQKKYGIQWLVIPQFENKRLANIKYRTLSLKKKKFRREEGMDSILFNCDRVDQELNYVFLFEGETDCMTADTCLKIKNALGVTVGARGFKEEWIEFLDQFEKIYIVYDNDVAGRKGAEKIAKRLGKHRCYNIELDKEDGDESIDLNEWWRRGNTKEDFESLVEKAETFETKDVYQISTILTSVEADLHFSGKLDAQGFVTQWDNVNKVLGSMVAGDLVVLSGLAKVGKTTWALNVLLNHSLNGVPTMFYCLEMRPERVVTKVISYFRGVERSFITPEDVVYVKTRFGRKPFYLAHSYKFTTEEVFDTMREAVNRYGIELLAFDHLHFLIRDSQNVSSQVATTVREFKLLAEDLKIPILLICQPRKITAGRLKRMTTDDLRDSSAIGQDADTVIILHRNRIEGVRRKEDGTQQLFDPETEVIVDATRYNPGGVARLWYSGGISRYFLNAKEERRFLSYETKREI